MNPIRKFRIESLSLDANGGAIEANCADITFINFGNNANPPVGATLIIDNVIIVQPGQEFIISADSPNELNITKHRFQWDTSTGTTINGVVARKIFAL